jgi:hypothetical protein
VASDRQVASLLQLVSRNRWVMHDFSRIAGEKSKAAWVRHFAPFNVQFLYLNLEMLVFLRLFRQGIHDRLEIKSIKRSDSQRRQSPDFSQAPYGTWMTVKALCEFLD